MFKHYHAHPTENVCNMCRITKVLKDKCKTLFCKLCMVYLDCYMNMLIYLDFHN